MNLLLTIFHYLVTQSKQVSSICTTSKALGNTRLTSLTSSEQAGTLNTAAAGAKIQAIIDAINGLQPQIAQIKGHVERHCFHIIEFRQFYALQNEIECYRGAPQAAFNCTLGAMCF